MPTINGYKRLVSPIYRGESLQPLTVCVTGRELLGARGCFLGLREQTWKCQTDRATNIIKLGDPIGSGASPG